MGNAGDAKEHVSETVERSIRESLNSLTEGYVIYDNNGRLIFCNQAFKDFYNYSDTDCAPGTHFRDLGELDVQRKTVVLKSITDEEYVSRRDQFKTAPLSDFMIFLSDGRVLKSRDQITEDGCVVSVQTDVTDIYKNDQGLEKSQARMSTLMLDAARNPNESTKPVDRVQYELINDTLSEIFHIMPAAAYSLQADTFEPLFVSPNIKKITGYDAKDLIGNQNWWKEGVHPDDLSDCMERIRRIFSETPLLIHEYRFKHKSGHYIWIHDQLTLISEGDSRPTKLVGSWMDITHVINDRKKAELADSIDHLNYGIISLDCQSAITSANSRAKKILQQNDGLSADKSGRIKAYSPGENQKLEAAIQNVILKKNDAGITALSISRPSMKKNYSVMIMPANSHPILPEQESLQTFIFISDPELRIESSVKVLSDLYGFTQSESKVVSALVAGNSLKEAAASLSITDGTARQYLKQAFSKTKTRSQSALISLILMGPSSLWIDRDKSNS